MTARLLPTQVRLAQDIDMSRHSLAALTAGCLCVIVHAPAARAADAPTWRPVGDWVFDTKGERCAAAHTYASGEKRVTVGLKRNPMSDGVTMLVQAPGDAVGMEQLKVRVIFGDGPVEKTAILHRSAKAGHDLYEFGATREELLQLSQAQRLAVTARKLRFAGVVAGLDRILGSLDLCMSDLLDRWGLSKHDQARLASYPEPEQSRYFQPGDYPISALMRNAIGGVEVRMTVHSDGSVSDCQLVRSSGHDDIDRITCDIVARRVRFKPALDREGKPMASPYYFHVRWMMKKEM